MLARQSAKPRLAVLVRLIACAAAFTLVFACVCASTAFAGSIKIYNSGTKAIVSAPTSVKYKASEVGKALWNHGTFFVYFFEGTRSAQVDKEKVTGSDIATSKVSVQYQKGVSWAKVHVAAVSSSTKDNGGKNSRLKTDSGANLYYEDYLASSQKFYVWIGESGGDGGKVSLRSTTTRTVYAGNKTYKNAETITVSSQHGGNHHDNGESESPYYDVLNIPFKWSGKDAHQVPYKAFSSRGVGNNDNYHTFYRLTWKQYSNGTTYSGYSPYKLQHNTTSAVNIWASVNLASVGISLAPTYTNETLKTPADAQFRNTDSFLACFLRASQEQVLLDTEGGALVSGSNEYRGNAVSFKKGSCMSKVALPKKGTKSGRDGTKNGYRLAGYIWKSGTNRAKFSSAKPKSAKAFVSFDQSNPNKVTVESNKITLCNFWQIPEFGPDNMDYENGGFLKAPTAAKVTFKAIWEPLPFAIHYIVNGAEIDVATVDYDSAYKLKEAPLGSSGWRLRYKDGAVADTGGYMPAQDIYAYAETANESGVRYYVDGKLVAAFDIPFGQGPLQTTYRNKNSYGTEFDGVGTWFVDSATFTASYKDHYNKPVAVSCTHYVDTSYYVDEQVVSSGYWTIDDYGEKTWVPTTYTIPGYWVDDGYYQHSYDLEDDYSPYVVKSYSKTYSAPQNPNGGTWLKWYSNAECTAKAKSSYVLGENDGLSFYSYTNHKVTYKVNGKVVSTSTYRYGDTVNPYLFKESLNSYGGTSYGWYTDESCTTKAPQSFTMGSSDVVLYGYTEHTIHFWMDANTDVGSDSGSYDQSGGGEDEDGDDGSSDEDPKESRFCLDELTVRYGQRFTLPCNQAESAKLTRGGCEDWLSTNGKWFSDPDCTNQVGQTATCTGDAVYYSYNNVKLTYGLTISARQLEEKHELLDSNNKKVQLASFLPQPRLYRFGTIVKIEGDGAVHWVTSGGYKRSAKSQQGGFLEEDASGTAEKSMTLQRSVTVYKQWVQGVFDGITTS